MTFQERFLTRKCFYMVVASQGTHQQNEKLLAEYIYIYTPRFANQRRLGGLSVLIGKWETKLKLYFIILYLVLSINGGTVPQNGPRIMSTIISQPLNCFSVQHFRRTQHPWPKKNTALLHVPPAKRTRPPSAGSSLRKAQLQRGNVRCEPMAAAWTWGTCVRVHPQTCWILIPNSVH